MIGCIKKLSFLTLLLSFFVAFHPIQATEESSEDRPALETTEYSDLPNSSPQNVPVESIKISLIFLDGRFGIILDHVNLSSNFSLETSMIVRDKLNTCLENDDPWGFQPCFSFETSLIKDLDNINVDNLYLALKARHS